MNLTELFHPPARDDRAPYDGDPVVRDSGLPPRCRSAICRISISPTLQVQVNLPGARSRDHGVLGRRCSRARQFSTIAGLDNMTSEQHARGQTTITIQFVLGRNIDGASLDVQNAISTVIRKLPPNLPAPPVAAESESDRPAHHSAQHEFADAADDAGGRLRCET